ncbi:cation transporter [Spirosoma soli]|uniref:Cation transporter n=1 Tax=Spirosoma soli TaxID=1770529 RepID=A0ABW5M6K5_9BACT
MHTTTITHTKGALWRIARGLALFTVLYNIGEGLISLYFGVSDAALTLAGFGADSFIEVISGLGILAMIVRLQRHKGRDRGRFEQLALRTTGVCFYALVILLMVGAALSLWQGRQPETTTAGVVISLISIGIMRGLAAWKIRTGKRLQSAPIIADGQCTMVCVYMSVVLLVSSLLYVWFRIPYIDAAGMLGLAWFSLKEGQESFEKANGAECCDRCH